MLQAQLLLRQELIQLRHEGIQILELAVDRGESDVGHLIHLPQPVHHLFAYILRFFRRAI